MRYVLRQGYLNMIVGWLNVMNLLLHCISMFIGTCMSLRYKTYICVPLVVFLPNLIPGLNQKFSEVLRESDYPLALSYLFKAVLLEPTLFILISL